MLDPTRDENAPGKNRCQYNSRLCATTRAIPGNVGSCTIITKRLHDHSKVHQPQCGIFSKSLVPTRSANKLQPKHIFTQIMFRPFLSVFFRLHQKFIVRHFGLQSLPLAILRQVHLHSLPGLMKRLKTPKISQVGGICTTARKNKTAAEMVQYRFIFK